MLLGAAAVFASAPAAAAEVNQAQALVDAGGMSGDELAYWTVQARRYRDQVEWRNTVERDTRRLADSSSRAIDLENQAAEVALIAKVMEEDRLRRERFSDSIRQLMREHYGTRFEGDPEPIDPKATASSGPLQDYLRKQAQAEARARAKAQGVGAGLKTVRAVDRWVQVVVDSTGEVIENDPVDVAHARLEDLERRQAELEARLQGKLDPAEVAAIVDQLLALEREVDRALSQIAGYVFRLRSPLRNVCFPPPVKGEPVAALNCRFWAKDVPIVVDGGAITVVWVRLDIDFRKRHDEASVAYYWRYAGEPKPTDPQSTLGGELRHGPDGALSLVIPWTDEDGDEQETLYPLTLTTKRVSGNFPPFTDGGPFELTFLRDPDDYISWDHYERSRDGRPPLPAGEPMTAKDLAPLEIRPPPRLVSMSK
ncbi:hypothetical protein [Caulobacter sp. 17J65-9]|uniref:hypothetical protein n=1 Tax=Caulobacter sp. 17J65-9 TaxID=2709382 RepID=UPI0013C9FBDE|nr:hypothetical protein [Caulobacter sp. 17J65-9]NEX94961.1 hypothetical protein [Caulobacter sp. 17J65-9]